MRDDGLRAFNAETGALLFKGGGAAEVPGTVRRFLSPIAANGALYVAGSTKALRYVMP